MNNYLRVTTIVLSLVLLILAFASPALGQQALLYQETFDSGQARGWELEAGWTVANGVGAPVVKLLSWVENPELNTSW